MDEVTETPLEAMTVGLPRMVTASGGFGGAPDDLRAMPLSH
jgi:hypothetical protein